MEFVYGKIMKKIFKEEKKNWNCVRARRLSILLAIYLVTMNLIMNNNICDLETKWQGNNYFDPLQKKNKNIINEIAHMQQFSIFLNAIFSFGRINNPFYCPLSKTQLLLITALIILRWLTAVSNRLRRWFRTDGAVGGRRSAPRPCEGFTTGARIETANDYLSIRGAGGGRRLGSPRSLY